MRYYVVAGERSGDLHGGNLLKALRKEDPDAQFRGIGGSDMQTNGLDVVISYNQLAFMGFWEVITNLFTIKKFLNQTKEDLLAYKPDVLILIDYPGFNMRLAKFANEQGIKVFYYISPKIWAWNTGRAYSIKKYVDQMFTILPFETSFYKQFDVDVNYVGNPVVDAVKAFQFDSDFTKKHQIDSAKAIAVLPGSRKQEVKAFIPQVVSLAEKMPDQQFLVSKVDNLPEQYYQGVHGLANVRLIEGNTYDLLRSSLMAIVTSGTATLETAVLDVPQVVCYKTSAFTYQIAKQLIKVPYISLVNLIMEKEVVKELIQADLNTDNIVTELRALLSDAERKRSISADYALLREKLGKGDTSALAAQKMIEYLNEA